MKPLILLFLALVISALAVLAYDLLPMRTLALVPSDQDTATLFADTSGTTEAAWLDKKNLSFRCTYHNKPSSYKFCGLDVTLGDGAKNGLDLSIYETIALKLSYQGDAKVLRVYVRNAMTSTVPPVTTDSTFKYLNTFLPVNDLKSSLTIRLAEFSVAEWWLRAARLPREYSYPEFVNATNIGVDAPFPAPFGDHDFTLSAMTLKGHYISKENWYLCVMLFWFTLLLVRLMFHYLTLWREANFNRDMLEDALDRTHHLEQESQHYKELSVVDPLTNVFNRRGMKQLGEHLFASLPASSYCIIMIDVDHFKNINDEHGHDTGDKILQEIAVTLKKNTRNIDKIARWGGEEFVILCPNTSTEQALLLSENLRNHVSQIRFNGTRNKLTASFGVAMLIDNDLEVAINHADKALYQAKKSGRNCCCVYPDAH